MWFSKFIKSTNSKYLILNERFFSLESAQHSKIVVVGGGAGGLAVSSSLCRKFGPDNVLIIDKAENHYYQAMWTLVGAGIKKFEQSRKNSITLLPSGVKFIQSNAKKFLPSENCVLLENDQKISYDFLLVSIGIELRYDLIPGLVDALENDPRVCSNYSPKYVQKTFLAFENFCNSNKKEGSAIFTYPNSPVKCAGAPQKIMYLFDDYLRRKGIRDSSKIQYFTSLGAIFGIKKYAEALTELCNNRDIIFKTRQNLAEIDWKNSKMVFENLDKKEPPVNFQYDFAHITPPMCSYDVIKSSDLADPANGFVEVDSATLQHKRFPNVFAIGDCASLPAAKTAASVAAQSQVVSNNMISAITSTKLTGKYDGYASCPLVTARGKCILAEFDYSGQPLETFPFDQSKESQIAYFLKAQLMPYIYWYGLIRGIWPGPKYIRKILHLGMGK